jgi:tetratricopeptide (TPR) repeat protein
LQIQEQLHDTQLAIERTEHARQEAQASAAQDALSLSNRLQAIEQSLLVQHVNEGTVADAQRTNRLLMGIIALFAVFGFGGTLLMGYFQWRAVSRLGEIAAALPAGRVLGGIPTAGALGFGEHEALSNGLVEQSNTRLIGLIQQMEKRILELEHTAALPLKVSSPESNGVEQHAPEPAANSIIDDPASQIAALLERGQSFLNSDQPEYAVASFDEALALNPNNVEALVKKGTALEKMRKPQEALECYDRAIVADGSLTIAYLHKGGLYSRLERYGEAMECYERALRTQEKKRAA